MPAAAAFADILDEMVGAPAESRRGADRPPAPSFVPPHPFLFETPYRPFRTSPSRGVATESGAAYQRPAAPRSAPASVRPSRKLTSRQLRALDAFVALGARLTADSSAAELRRAFRALALEFHPDRHPGTDAPEQARLTRLLADLNEHHQHLLAAFRAAA